jgi:hypothetical protein
MSDERETPVTDAHLPDEALIPARIVLEADAFDRLTQVIENPPEPTKALRELMLGNRP